MNRREALASLFGAAASIVVGVPVIAKNPVDFKIPEEAKSKLPLHGGIISDKWDVSTTDIPADVFRINQRLQEQVGYPIAQVFVSGEVFNLLKGE